MVKKNKSTPGSLRIYELTLADSNSINRYVVSAFLITVALFVRLNLWPVDYGLQYVTLFPAVAVTAVIAGFWPGIFAMSMGLFFATFILTYPYYSFSLEAIRNSWLSNLVFVFDGLVVCFSIESMHGFRRKYIKELEDSRKAHAKSELDRQTLDNIFDNVIDGIITIDEAGIIESFNKAASQIFGYAESEVIGNNVSMLMPEPYRSQHNGYLQRYISTGNKKIIGISRELTGMRKDGSVFPMEISVSEIVGDERKFTGILRDITIRKAQEKHIHFLAHHDHLTGLPNRTLFVDRFQQQLSKAKREHSKVALMFVDLDKFKPINDTYGHDIGDMLLKEVAIRLLHCLRESDTAARIGGDEFVVVLPSIGNSEEAMLVAEKIRHALSLEFNLANENLLISSSIGVAIYPDHGAEEKQLIKNADTAMYYAKKNKGNRIMLYQSKTLG